MIKTEPPVLSPDAVTQESRSFFESPRFRIDWRYHQAQGYAYAAWQSGYEVAELPDSETDRYIGDCFAYCMDDFKRANKEFHWLKWVFDCNDGDHLIGPGVRAMILAGRRDEEIAEVYGIPSNRIEYFANLFFDVRPYLERRAILSQIVPHLRPMSSRHVGSTIENYERLIFSIALDGPPELLDDLLCGIVPTAGELAKVFRSFEATSPVLAR